MMASMRGGRKVSDEITAMCRHLGHFPETSALSRVAREMWVTALEGGLVVGKRRPIRLAMAVIWEAYKKLGRPEPVFFAREITKHADMRERNLYEYAKLLRPFLTFFK